MQVCRFHYDSFIGADREPIQVEFRREEFVSNCPAERGKKDVAVTRRRILTRVSRQNSLFLAIGPIQTYRHRVALSEEYSPTTKKTANECLREDIVNKTP